MEGPRMYGNWRRPRAAGVASLSLLGTVVIIVGLIAGVVAVMFGGLFWALGVLATVGLLVAVVEFRDAHGVSVAQRTGERLMWRVRKARKETTFRSSIVAADGEARLPGVLASTELRELVDPYGRPFACLSWPNNLRTVVFSAEPDGQALVDQSTIDVWVARWGLWLGQLSLDSQIVQAQVIIETAPDTGTRLIREISAQVVDDAPDIALDMLAEVAGSYPVGGASVRAWIVLTIQMSNVKEADRDLAAHMGPWSQGLAGTGAGAVRPTTATELVRAVRCAYDPAAEALYDQAALYGEVPDLSWTEAGPMATEAAWDTYRHDSGLSRTWIMSEAPRSNVVSGVLERLLSPDADFARKRVALIYKPIEAGRAAEIVEADAAAAKARAESSRRATARVQTEQAKAEATRFEEANGAGLIDFAAVMTATVWNQDELPSATERLESLASSAHLKIRPAYGSQDAAFVAALPVGMVASRFSRIPETVKGMV